MQGCGACEPSVDAAAPAAKAPPGIATFRIPSMDCAVEESEIRRTLDRVPGIRSLNFQLGARRLAIDATDDTVTQALAAIRAIGYRPEPLAAPNAGDAAHGDHAHGHDHSHSHSHTHDGDHAHGSSSGRLGLALLLALAAEAAHAIDASTFAVRGLGLALAALAIGLSGIETYTKGLSALRHGKLNINALMSVAVTGAFAIGQWPEAAMVMALYAIAELIEARAADRARNAIQGLVALVPDQAEVLQVDQRWASVPSAEVALQAVVRIRPGARVPLDGVITEGRSALNQSPVTGESLPVEKTVGRVNN